MVKDKEEFLRRKKGIRNEADVMAQQLINIYRQLSVLGEGAEERYKEQLLREVNADVLASFKVIPGGDEVREYYAFLTNTNLDADDEQSALNSDTVEDCLPKAEEISPLWASYQLPVAPVAHTVAVESENNSNFTTTPVQVIEREPEVSVVTKTVKIPVGVDEEKAKDALVTLLENQRDTLKRVFDSILIDSNIDVMNYNLKEAAKKANESFDSVLSELPEILKHAKVDENSAVVSQTVETKRKPLSGMSLKNARRRSEQKFSVDMSEDE